MTNLYLTFVFTDFVMVFVPKTHAKIYFYVIIVATGWHPQLQLLHPFRVNKLDAD